jgi:hypothetical protein
LTTDLFTTTRFAASAPCWARAMRGEPLGVMRRIDSKIVWSCTTLKSGFRFWTSPTLGVRALDAYDLPIVGYLLELFCDGSSLGVAPCRSGDPLYYNCSKYCPQSRGSHQLSRDQGMQPMMMNSMLQLMARGWMSQLGFPGQSRWCGGRALHRDPILNRHRPM